MVIMAKKHKTVSKIKTLYRGPIRQATYVADDKDTRLISEVIQYCVDKSKRSALFKIDDQSHIKIVAGLTASLRNLKAGKTRAILYDSSASSHLTKYLTEFAFQQSIPIVESSQLSDIGSKVGLTSLLVLSFVTAPSKDDLVEVLRSQHLSQLWQVLQSLPKQDKRMYQTAQIDQVRTKTHSKP